MERAEGRPRLFVHIGTHKTGTTSFQHWLLRHEEELLAGFGLGVYHGAFPNNREVGLACASTDRSLPTRGIPQWVDPEWRKHVAELVADQLERDEDLVLSCEALSFLRTSVEVERLARMLTSRDVFILVALRNRTDFLRSWSEHLQRDRYKLSRDPRSFAYVEPDSWLADYEVLLSAYGAVFSNERVRTIDYDVAIAQDGSVIPALMREVVGPDASIPEWRGARKNVGEQVERSRQEARESMATRFARFARQPIATTRRVVNRIRNDARY
jgi:hypothetical protein